MGYGFVSEYIHIYEAKYEELSSLDFIYVNITGNFKFYDMECVMRGFELNGFRKH